MSDIYLKPTAAGEDLKVAAGCPQMTGGLDNAIYMSLFTGDSWMNALSDDSGKYSSKIPALIGAGTVNNKIRLDIVAEAERVLAWLVTDNIVKSVAVRAEIPEMGQIFLAVRVEQPEKSPEFKYTLHWETQKISIVNNEPEPIKSVRLYNYVSDSGDTYVSDTGEEYISDSYLIGQ